MTTHFLRHAYACIALLFCSAVAPAAEQQHILWSLQGKTNKVYLLGSMHLLRESEKLPAAIDSAYADADALLMELDMDDIDAAQLQQAALELAVQPEGRTLQQQLGAQVYEQFATKTRALGIEPGMLDRFQPWFAAITLVQLQLMKLGFDPEAGVEKRLTRRAAADGKQIEGLETVREQLGIMARLPEKQQREFLLYSVNDAQRMASETELLLSAWRSGDAAGMAKILQEGFDEYPDLYRPLTVDRNRQWLPRIEQLLDDREDYLVVVGALHLVGKESVIDLLERKGHKLRKL